MAEVPVQNDAPVISESDLVSKVQIEPTTEKRPREEEPAEEEEPGILEQLMALFKENHGRDPTEAEVQQWRDTLREAAEEADAGVQAAAPKEDNTPRGKAPEPVAQVSVEPAAKKQRVAEA